MCIWCFGMKGFLLFPGNDMSQILLKKLRTGVFFSLNFIFDLSKFQILCQHSGCLIPEHLFFTIMLLSVCHCQLTKAHKIQIDQQNVKLGILELRTLR